MMKPSRDLFPKTDTKAVRKVQQGASTARRCGLSDLYKLYWGPLYAVARRRGYSADEARDLTQGYFTTRLVVKNDIAAYDPVRGKFRHWLRRCFENYLANCWDHAHSEANGGGAPHLPFDTVDAVNGERCYHAEFAYHRTPDMLFERCYAITLLGCALDALQEEWGRKGGAGDFEKLKGFITYEDDQRYKAVAVELGTSEGAVKTDVCRLRSRFRALLRSEVAKTERPEDVDAVLLDLLKALTDDTAHHLQAGAQCIVEQPC